MDINKLVKNQKNFFKTGKTKDVNFRIESLNKLYDAIKKYEKEICEALKNDLNKSQFESYMSEIGMVLSDLNYAKKKVRTFLSFVHLLTFFLA